jgi:hypothetical protein
MSQTVIRYFVNREHIFSGFGRMLSGESEKQIMLVKAPGGMGKSWLVAKLKHECSIAEPRIHFASIDFKDGQAYDYLSVIRRTRDEIGAAYFNHLTEVINAATGVQVNLKIESSSSQPVNIQRIQDVTNSEINIAGGHIVKDNFFLVQVDSQAVRFEIKSQIVRAFFEQFRQFLAAEKAVLFFDTYGKAPQAIRYWLEGDLLVQIRDGKLPGLVVVITGREVPELDMMWKHCATRPGLEPLGNEDVAKYLVEKRGLKDVDPDTLYKATLGNPQLLGMLADNIDQDLDW